MKTYRYRLAQVVAGPVLSVVILAACGNKLPQALVDHSQRQSKEHKPKEEVIFVPAKFPDVRFSDVEAELRSYIDQICSSDEKVKETALKRFSHVAGLDPNNQTKLATFVAAWNFKVFANEQSAFEEQLFFRLVTALTDLIGTRFDDQTPPGKGGDIQLRFLIYLVSGSPVLPGDDRPGRFMERFMKNRKTTK